MMPTTVLMMRTLTTHWTTVMMTTAAVMLVTFILPHVHAQTEGDTGYDYNDAYDEVYEDDTAIGMDPLFDVPIVNVTVVKGQTAVLPCSIEYLGKFKVAWLDHNSIPLTYEERRVVDDTRFSVVRPYVKEWNLQIRDIRWEDEGQYRCTINTNPVKSKLVMLHVKVPAEIIDEFSSGDVTVEEGDVITLTCNVTGVPLPYVDWKRKSTSNKAMSVRDHRNCKLKTSGPGSGAAGATLLIQNVSRYCDDIYECTANNGVPPPVSRQMKLTVEFAPHISMPNRRIRQMKGRETILECAITAFPHAVNYWEKDTKRITSSMKHRIEAYDEGDHTLTLSLRIHITDPSDFGEYKCVASNRLGKDEGSMYLFDYSDMESKHPPFQQPPEAGLDHSKQVVRPTDSIFPPTFQSNGNRHLTNHVGQQQPQQQQPDQQQPTHRRGYTQLEVTQVYRWTDKSSKKYEPFNERIIGGCYGYVAISNWLFFIVSSFHVIL